MMWYIERIQKKWKFQIPFRWVGSYKDYVVSLQVVSNSLSNPGDASGILDQDVDGERGLTDAVITLKTLSGN